MKKLLPFVAALLLSAPAFGAGYVGSAIATGSTTNLRLGSTYTPAAGNSLLLKIISNKVIALPLTGYSGTGTPGDGVNTYNLVCYGFNQSGSSTVTFSTAPTTGATTGTLSATFSGSTDTNYTIVFSDSEFRNNVTLTNGSTAVSWTGALTGTTFTTQLLYADYGNISTIAIYQATGVAATAVQPGAAVASGSSSVASLVYVAEYSGVSAATSRSASSAPNPADCAYLTKSGSGSTGANTLTSGTVTVAGSSILWADANDLAADSGLSAGTSPIAFTGRTQVTGALAEDASASTNSAATFGTTSSDDYDTIEVMGLALPAGSATTPPSRMFLIQ